MAQDALEIIERDVEVIEVVGGGDVEVIEVFDPISVEVVEVFGRGEAEVVEVFDSVAEVIEVVERGPQGPCSHSRYRWASVGRCSKSNSIIN